MSKFTAILYDSFLEIKDRKIFYLYWIVTVLMILIFLLVPSLELNGQDILGSGIIDNDTINEIVARFYDQFFGFMLLLMVFGSAGLAPAFLGKGRVELALSKPMSRIKLLTLKFLAIYLVTSVILIVAAILIWLTISIRLGGVSWFFFYGLILALIQYAIIYSIVFFLGIFANSGAVAIMGYFIIRIVTGLLAGREMVYQLLGDSIWKTILDTIYHILPKIGTMSENYIRLMTGRGTGDLYPVWSSSLFGLAMFLLALLYFKRKDY